MTRKLDSIVGLGAVTAGLLFIETNHRTVLAPPAVAGPAQPADRCASADVRYAAGRLAFFEGGFVAGLDWRRIADRFSYPPECR